VIILYLPHFYKCESVEKVPPALGNDGKLACVSSKISQVLDRGEVQNSPASSRGPFKRHKLQSKLEGKKTMEERSAMETLVSQHIVAAMKARDAERTGALRLIKTALMNKAIEKRTPLTQAESEQVLASMIKQRRDSIEQFTKGNRPDLAAKENAEIAIIEEYLPKAAGDEALAAVVSEAIAEITGSTGHKPGPKDMGAAMKAVQARLQAAGLRAEGRSVSELVKRALA
jgi:uncharacterized protein YqeY